MKRGFTLIELLVVIAIIGILATIVLVSMTGVQKSGRDTARKADMRQIVSAMQMYYAENEAYPTITGSDPGSIGSYMLETPKDPSGGSYTWLDNSSNTQEFCVYATLETETAWYVATHAGTFTITTGAPTSISDCLP